MLEENIFLKEAPSSTDKYFRENLFELSRLDPSKLSRWCDANNLSPEDRRSVQRAIRGQDLLTRFSMNETPKKVTRSPTAHDSASSSPGQKIGVYPADSYELEIPNNLDVNSWSQIEAALRQHLFGLRTEGSDGTPPGDPRIIIAATVASTIGVIGLGYVLFRRKQILSSLAKSIVSAANTM
jgi:hypothetical protein